MVSGWQGSQPGKDLQGSGRGKVWEEQNKPWLRWHVSTKKSEDAGNEMLDVNKDVADKCSVSVEAAKMSWEATERVLEAAKKRVQTAEKAKTAAPKLSERHCNVVQVFDKVEDEVNRKLQELKVAVGAAAEQHVF